MKSTGIIRPVDSLGRVVLPIELRRSFDIAAEDSLEIYVEDDRIILKKYAPTCMFCGARENTVEYKGKILCKDCIRELSEKLD